MILIIMCHIFQEFNSPIAQIANVGVQIFLFISGYLYSHKRIEKTVDFIRKRVLKISLDYYIYIFFAVPFIFAHNIVSFKLSDFWNLITMSGQIPELGHLWFVPTIIVCYCLTPLFWEILDEHNKHSLCFIGVLLYIVFRWTVGRFNPAYIFCFYLGLYYHRCEDDYREIKFQIMATTLAVVYLFIRLTYGIGLLNVPEEIDDSFRLMLNYGHVCFGMMCFFALRYFYKKILNKVMPKKILKISDRYSYQVYLTHQIYILGAFSIYRVVNSKGLATILILFLIIISSFTLHVIGVFAQNKCFPLLRRVSK